MASTMAAARSSKSLLKHRRRAGGDSDEEESVYLDEDSQSEISSTTGADENATAEDVTSGRQPSQTGSNGLERVIHTHSGATTGESLQTSPPRATANTSPPKAAQSSEPVFATTSDTQIMLNGTQAAQQSGHEEVVDFDELALKQQAQAGTGTEGQSDRRRNEHDDYRQKREADPTFIPNRGNFFMHDPRASNQRGPSAPGRGRGRGRGFVGGPFAPSNFAQGSRVAEAPWAHDLHDSINAPQSRQAVAPVLAHRPPPAQHNAAAAARAQPATDYRPQAFSSDKLLGKVQMRVSLPGMKSTIPFPGIPVRQHTRLPDHRPSLRRDKPVRISLPDRSPQYIFPSQDRSFIFIPRAMRPNQQGSGHPRGGFGMPSRRTSAYAGSMHTSSMGMSRRSSLARDMGREHMFSPAGSVGTRHLPSSAKPVVRLPQHGSPSIGSPAGSVMGPIIPMYAPPQTPHVEHYRETSMMYQPRPQKTISVSGIDSPAALSMHIPHQQHQQPFENQLPHHVVGTSFGSSTHHEGAPPPYFPFQGQAGTPLSHIPERAIHAQPFQPPQAYGYYDQYAQQQGHYYQLMPDYAPQTDHVNSQQSQGGEQNSQQSMMAHESNGMVYYIDHSQVQSYPQQAAFTGQDGFLQPASYAMSGMGGMMTPSPEGTWYYPSAGAYYPQGQ